MGCEQNGIEPKKPLLPFFAGSYWIYQTKMTSADDVVSIFPHLDSVWIEKDTVINNKVYWKQIGTLSGTYFLRDSADCVLRRQLSFEQIIYSTSRDTLLSYPPVYQVVTEFNEKIQVKAGNFRANTCRLLLRKGPETIHHANDLPSYDDKFYSGEHFICSDEVGLLKDIYYYLGGTVEYELIRYQLN